jgi:hypothetical protein
MLFRGRDTFSIYCEVLVEDSHRVQNEAKPALFGGWCRPSAPTVDL